MFTECPECSAAYRVTAKILQQAGGRVLCGGCGKAFSAIDYLSEDEPVSHNQDAVPAAASGDELTPDDMLAETHKQLLETLDELAGPEDVRIEDTGTEWRVLNYDDDDGQAGAPDASHESLHLVDVTQVPPDARRYDDDTPLTENVDGEKNVQDTPRPVPAQYRAGTREDRGTSEFDESQPGLALSEPGEWTDLLDEFSEVGTATDDIADDEPDKEVAAEAAPTAEAEIVESEKEVTATAAPTEAGLSESIEEEITIDKLFDENSAEVETIILEGEFVRGAIEEERLQAEIEARNRLAAAESLRETDAGSRGMRGGRRGTGPASYGVIAGTILLALLLVGQLTHAYRETLSTYGLFNQTLGPIYRLLGNPVTPEWDIKGWRFEATNGKITEDEDVLTILSRIGNKSLLALPYPLVHVSLTDRWEEIIGSRVLLPNEYLAGDLDPSRPVIPGENFTAVITIDEPSADATGFKLNVCYRVSPGRVRCATEDFKD